MGLFGGRNDDTEPETAPAPIVFEPQPLDDWVPGDSVATDSPIFGEPDFYALPARATPKKPGAKKGAARETGAKKTAYVVRPPKPGMSESERRAALRAQMADLTQAYKDAPIEEMEAAIKETLVAHGQEVPSDWVTTIAEGLRRHGPTRLNYDGVGPSKR